MPESLLPVMGAQSESGVNSSYGPKRVFSLPVNLAGNSNGRRLKKNLCKWSVGPSAIGRNDVYKRITGL